jgi:hypothetical protein
MADISGNFNWKTGEKLVSSLVQGEDAAAIYESIKDSGLGLVAYDPRSRTLIGSTSLIAARIDTLLREFGVHVASPTELMSPDITRMIQSNYPGKQLNLPTIYELHSPRIILRTLHDSYTKNLPLIKRIQEEIIKKEEKLNLPVLIKGFDFKSWSEDKSRYGLDIVPRDDFTITHDERLSGRYSQKRVLGFDENEIPIFSDKLNFRNKGLWSSRLEGLSGFSLVNLNKCLGSELSWASGDCDLARSLVTDRLTGAIVLISDYASEHKFK